MWCIIETEENGNLCVSAAPKKWIKNNILYWPKTLAIDRRNPQDIQEGVWSEYRFTILKDDIGTYEEALAKEKFYSEHRHTESENEKRVQKALKKKHPVNYNISGNEIDVNDLFDTKSNVKSSPAVTANNKPEKLMVSNRNNIKRETNRKKKVTSKNMISKKGMLKTATSAAKNTHSSTKAAISSVKSGTIGQTSLSKAPATPTSTFVPPSTIPNSLHQSGQSIQGGIPSMQPILPQDIFEQQTTELGDFTHLFTADHSNNLFNVPSTNLSLDTPNSYHLLQSVHAPVPQQTNSEDLYSKIISEIGRSFQTVLQEIETYKQMLNDEKKQRQEMEARLQANLDIINQKLLMNSKRIAPIDDNAMYQQFKLPIADCVTVPQFEKFLKHSTDFKENLTTKLSRIGGRDHPAKLRAVAKRIITDEALQQFTWKGTNTKDPFIQFKMINDVIKDAINTDNEPYTDHDHNNCMKEYCKHANTRLKYKKSRKHSEKVAKKLVKETVQVLNDENIESEENFSHDSSIDDTMSFSNDEQNHQDEMDTETLNNNFIS